MDGVINMTSAAELITWSDLEAARDAVADGEIFAKGVNVDADGGYEVRLRRHGKDAIAEIRVMGSDAWQLVDAADGDGVIDLRDIDTDVSYFPAR